jgi:HD-GYP domain-containing protein (c-di-GMP phosphodiesterase class II)
VALSEQAHALVGSAGVQLAAHSHAVAELAVEASVELCLPPSERAEVELTALLHDVGKIGLMDQILDKPNGLTAYELELVRRHPLRGQAILERAGGPLAPIGVIVRSCHERWDGRGYPDGLAGEEIPLAARIVFCCDAYDAMTSDRPYSPSVSHTRAIAELWSCAHTQFDPDVVAAVVRAAQRLRPPFSRDATAAAEPVGLVGARAGSHG